MIADNKVKIVITTIFKASIASVLDAYQIIVAGSGSGHERP